MPADPRRASTRAPHLFVSFTFTCILLAGAIAAAQSPPQVEGRVVDPQGGAVAAATVVATAPGTSPRAVTTDASGRFTFDRLAAGRYDFVVAQPGLQGEARGVAVSDSAPARLEIVLRLAAVSETLVVSTAQIDQPLSRVADSITVISGADLEARQVTTLGAAIGTVPGFAVARSGGPGTLTSLFPRGGESDFTLVLVDGVRANAFGGGLDLSQVPLGDVERIEIVRGPQSAIFGADAIGGVIQIVTRQSGSPTAGALLEVGSRDARRLQAHTSGSAGALRWQAGADVSQDDGFTGTSAASGERVSNDDARQRQGWLGAGWRFASGTDVQGALRYVDTERGAPGPYGSDPAGRFAGVDRLSRGTTDRRAASLRVVHPWGGAAGRVRQRVDVDVADYDLTFLSRFGLSESDTRRAHARVQTDAALDAGIGLSAGLEWLDERATSSFIRAAGSVVPVERRVIGSFAEARWNGIDRVSLQAGLRAEHITREAFIVNGFADDAVVSVNPKVAVSWLVSPGTPAGGATAWTRLRASAGTGIRPPDVFEIAFTDNPALKPERSRSAEAGITQALAGGAVQLDLAAFVNEYDDLIISVGSLRDVSRYRTDNVSNARARGVEVGGAWQAAPGFSVRAQYTLVATAILAIDGTAQAPSPYAVGDWLLRRPRHSGSLAAVWTAERLTLFGGIDGRGETLDAEPAFGPSGGLFRNPGRTVMDVGGSWRLRRGLDVFARVLNAFDRDYEDVLGFPSPGRTAYAGVRLAAGR